MIIQATKDGRLATIHKDLTSISATSSTSSVGHLIRKNDIKRVLNGQRQTAGGYQWINVEIKDLTKKN